jgi:hypothetical protein
MNTIRTRKPRCFCVYVLAGDGIKPVEANRQFNEFVADTSLPLAIFHDHFIGQAGGIAIFFIETSQERDALLDAAPSILKGWSVDIHPLIFSYSPAAFDEQIAFTLRAYRNRDWEQIRQEQRPSYGNPRREAETAAEDDEP